MALRTKDERAEQTPRTAKHTHRLFQPGLSQSAPAIAWLTGKGVSSGLLAGLFGTTPGHIRVLAHRGRRLRSPQTMSRTLQPDIHMEFPYEERRQLDIRPHPDEVIISRGQEARMDWLENEIERRAKMHAKGYRFVEGAASLRELRPYVGYPANARLIGLLARIHLKNAWFLVHSGLAGSAFSEAAKALDLSKIAYQESELSRCGKVYVQQFVDAGLICSQALLLSRQPQVARQFLELAKHASEKSGAPIGSDYYRQFGEALFDERAYEPARHCFSLSRDTMEKLGEAQNEAHLLMYGTRQTNLLDPVKWEHAQEVLYAVQKAFGVGSHESSVTVHWTAACGLAIDSPAAHRRALELLEANRETAERTGHQATIARLLAITPNLGLYPRLRAAWVRWALHENAYRSQ